MNEYRQGFNDIAKEVNWTLGKVFVRVILPLIALGMVISMIMWGMRIASQPAKIIEKTVDADNIIYNYEWFKQTYRDIEATRNKIFTIQSEKDTFVESAGPRKDWTFEDKNEYSRLSATVSGLKNHKDDLVATYNARSKMINRKIFKGKDIPSEIID